MSESPDVKASEGRGDVEFLRSGQHGRRATTRAVAKANEPGVEKASRMELICGVIGVAKGFFPLPDGQCRYGRTGVCKYRTPGGN